MPVVTVSVWQDMIDDATSAQLISGMTEAVVAAFGEQARTGTTVLVAGVPRSCWGVGGTPASALLPANE